MNREQAIDAMKSGARITHRYFMAHEWMELHGRNLHFEDGVVYSMEEFFHNRGKLNGWEDGYERFNSQKPAHYVADRI